LLASKKGNKEYTLDGPLIDGVRNKSRSLRALVGNCEDFLQEVTAMFELVVDIMSDGFEQTPKGHPEVAGEGVEYERGKSKLLVFMILKIYRLRHTTVTTLSTLL
jgi:hypothetical protein